MMKTVEKTEIIVNIISVIKQLTFKFKFDMTQ